MLKKCLKINIKNSLLDNNIKINKNCRAMTLKNAATPSTIAFIFFLC